MRIISLNANGIRSAANKGLFNWLAGQHADIVCIQETKAQLAQLDNAVFFPRGYHCFYHSAQKKGYSGVAIYSRHEPLGVQYGLGWVEFDAEARWLEVQFQHLNVVSLYLPSGSASELRQSFKMTVLARLKEHLRTLGGRSQEYIICGDWNIAHREIDLKNWKANKKNSGFLPEERAWLDELFGSLRFVDGFRAVNAEAEQYTWWSNRGQAWAKNVGWRIDYQITTPAIGATAIRTAIYKEERFSDHAPLILDYDYAI